jgi:hypothetical protein
MDDRTCEQFSHQSHYHHFEHKILIKMDRNVARSEKNLKWKKKKKKELMAYAMSC